ncbi:hypothetical protein NAT65_16180 [Achromobacter xylosoxidans]|uniref:hypothetical protein n=1 Tax=Alcaligenes xylosoxydans xylosoxydans TaxID=85698 RepID=UPI00203AC6C0|nr:hypothetical protein [Achromobacter xylosoxidans]MCM2572622.1 hypothetical protein [Achromobacter xylosoxidans]
MSEIKITVQGPVGSGKSALLGEIEILCKALGVPVRYADPSDAASEKSMTHADWTAYLEMYKPSVVLHEKGPDRAALASAPVAGEAKNYPGENVAERLDNMADDQPPGSQAQSDLYAAATIWRKHIAHRAAPQASEAVRTQVLAALESAQRFIRNGIEFGYIRMPDADTPDPAHRTPGLIDAAIRSLKSQADKDGGQERAGDARSALTWYAEQVAGCRKLGPDGDAARNALDTDGGQRARAALSATQAEQSEAPYWLCCGSKDPAHPGRQAPDCFDPERAKWGTRSQHATQAEQGERDA